MAGSCARHVDEAGRTSRGPGAGERHDGRDPLGEFCAAVANSAAARRIIKVGGSMTDGEKPDDNKVGPSWFFILLGIIIPLLIVFWLGRLQGVEAQYRVDAAARDARVAAADAAELCKNAGDRMVSCLRREIAAAEKEGHDAQDLTAQQQAAWAGMFNTLVGLLSAVGALIGLRWIKQTLDATRDGNRLADMEIRGWVGIEAVDKFAIIRAPDGAIMIKGSYKYTNHGNYPSLGITTHLLFTNSLKESGIEEYNILNDVDTLVNTANALMALPPNASVSRNFTIHTGIEDEILSLDRYLSYDVWILCRYETKHQKAYSLVQWRVGRVSRKTYQIGVFRHEVKPSIRISRLT